MLADIAERGGAEQSIDDRVDYRVRVRVACQPEFVGDSHAAQYQGAIGGESMDIVAGADTERHIFFGPWRKASARSRSSSVVIFRFV